MPPLIGKTLGKVRVDMFLAKGGMAEVYIGTHTTLHRSVAVKFLKADLQEDMELRDRFEREAQVIAMLRHPNIVQIFDFDSYENQPYLVMEYVPGISLGTYLRELHNKFQRLSLPQVMDLLKKIAGALTYAHENNVIHRDVKPANILLTSRTIPISVETSPLPPDTEPIITDFGLVRFLRSNKQTSTGVITGTPAYMSPEQARGEQADGRTDVYSLGVTVYEMLAGRVPFEADSTLGVLHQVVNDPHRPIEGISPALQKVMDRVLAKEPKDRFQTPLEFAQAFEAALSRSSDAETQLFNRLFVTANIDTQKRTKGVVDEKRRQNIIMPIIISTVGILLAISAISMARMRAGLATPTPRIVQQDNTESPPSVPSDVADNPVAPGQPIGIFRFQDGSKIADNVTFSSTDLPRPPDGSHYEAWLIEDDEETRFSIGVIRFDAENRAFLNYVDSLGRNLLAEYHGVEITIEPDPDNNPNPSNEIAYLTMLPEDGFTHVRHLLSGFPAAPNENGLIHGLNDDTELLATLANEMLASFETGDEPTVRLHAEQMLNLIVGGQSEEHRDWNGDGNIDDPGDGYGLLLNGTNSGYVQGSFSHANLSLSSPDATENMIVHGDHVKISVTNVSEWMPLLRDQLIAILNAPTLEDAQSAIRQSVAFAEQIRNGVDTNGNERVEPIPGEGGALTAYEHSYYMADIVIYSK